MSDEVDEKFAIGAKRVSVVYDFTIYSKSNYERDFKDFLEYQTKNWIKPVRKDQLDWKFYNVKNIRPISFDEFKWALRRFVTRVARQVLTENRAVIFSEEEFKLRIILFRVPGRVWYIEENPVSILESAEHKYDQFLEDIDAEEVEHHNYLVAGSFLIQAVAAPWYWLHRIDYTYLYRYLAHELEHHVQNMLGFYKFQNEVEARLKVRVRRVPNYRITYLFLTMCALLNEGIADYQTITNRPTLDFHPDRIIKFRRDLDALTTMIGKNKTEQFWIDNLSYGIFAGGAYYCGKIMMFTIALAFAKEKGIDVSIQLADGKYASLAEIDNAMTSETAFYVANPGPEPLQQAYSEVLKDTGYDYRKFIRLYEWACRALGISQRNMIIWYDLFDALKKKALKFQKAVSRQKRAEMYERISRVIQSIY